jgi:hypothetical protein
MVQKHVDFVDTSIHNQPGIYNKESSEQDLTIPDLRNVLITHTVTLNGISATALTDSGAQEDFVDTYFVLAYNLATTTTSLKRYVSLANGTRLRATLRDSRMVMTTRPEEGHLRFEDTISPTGTTLGRYDFIWGNPWLTRINPQPDWTFNTLRICLPDGTQGTFHGTITIPTHEALVSHLSLDLFDQAVDEGMDHFHCWLRPDSAQNMALYGLTLDSIPISDPLPSETPSPPPSPLDPPWPNRGPTHHIFYSLPVQPPTMEINDKRDIRFDKAFREVKLPAYTTPEDRQTP